MLYDIIVGPIETLVGWIFKFITNKLPSLGVIGAICGVSIAINILALPLYNTAESIQEKERQINKKLEPRVKRIKKGFKGDEQFMMLSEYYRQNGYHPLYALRGSLSILIEIPFFIAAYSYLSSSSILKESSFWIFSNLGEPDRLFSLTLGSLVVPVNILPIIMTAINFVSGYIYTRNATKRDKIQLYAMGLFFLVLLYNSPSGLVIYWICNNIFSLVKTIVLKTKHPGRILHAFISLGLLGATYMLRNTNRKKLILLAFCTVLFISWPYILKLYRKVKSKINIDLSPPHRRFSSSRTYLYLVLSAGTALALLCGLLLPSSTIASSPEEFSYIGNVTNPTSFIWSSLYFFLGLFVFWPLVIYKMFGEKTKRMEALVLFTILVVALCDAFLFNLDYGTLTSQFKITEGTNLEAATAMNTFGPFIVTAVTVLLFLIIDTYGRTGILSFISLSVIIAEIILGAGKINQIEKRFNAYSLLKDEAEDELNTEDEGIYTLSKDGKNIVVIFLDKAISSFLPYALEQVDGLEEQLEGFTYYPNTVSMGNCTVIGSPAMMGGYEYTPDNMNEREGFLQDLHNEASTLAPILFSNAGYSVTVTDPPFPNYSMRHDLSAFSNIENVKALEVYDRYVNKYISKFVSNNISGEEVAELTKNGAVNFSLLQVMPNIFRVTFYWCCFDSSIVDTDIINWLSALYYLDESTVFTESGNTYTFIGNELTHNPALLDSNLIAPASDDAFKSILPVTDENTVNYYSVFCAALKQIGRWMDYLRLNNVYDNTRIIITSDHGYAVNTAITTSGKPYFMPLLLVKDFDSSGELKSDDTFMTNADTIFLATDNLEEITMINPYTGNELKQDKDEGVDVYSIYTNEWHGPKLVGRTRFTLIKENAYHVSGNALDPSNWIPLLEWEEMMK